MKEQASKNKELMRDQMKLIEVMIRDEIRCAFPEYTIKVMEQVNEAANQARDQNQKTFAKIEDRIQTNMANVESSFEIFQAKLNDEGLLREQEDRICEERLGQQIRDLNELIELRYQKKQKTKIDFILEVKNMHAQIKIYGEKIKETQEMADIMMEIYHLMRVLECDVLKANQ